MLNNPSNCDKISRLVLGKSSRSEYSSTNCVKASFNGSRSSRSQALAKMASKVPLSTTLPQLLSSQEDFMQMLQLLHRVNASQITESSVELPPIVIFGKPGAGKSSVLRAISRVDDFQIRDGAGNAVTKEVLFCHRQDDVYNLEILSNSTEPQTPPLDQWSVVFNTYGSQNDIPIMIAGAQSYIDRETDVAKSAVHILRLEVPWPDYLPLNFVELPGSFHGPLPREVQAREALADRYLSNKICLFLPTIRYEDINDYSNALEDVGKYDPDGRRTIVVITHLDSGASPKEQLRTLGKNGQDGLQDETPAFFWHLLCTPVLHDTEVPFSVREAAENVFFGSKVWSQNWGACGSRNLRQRISRVILHEMKQTSTDHLEVLKLSLETKGLQLKKVERPLLNKEDSISQLVQMTASFHTMTIAALRGDYKDSFFDNKDDTNAAGLQARQLRTTMNILNRGFAYALSSNGSRRRIKEVAQCPEVLKPVVDMYPNYSSTVTFEEFCAEVQRMASRTQSCTLSQYLDETFDMVVFRQQSSPWNAIARKHIQVMVEASKSFAESLLLHLLGPNNGASSVLKELFVEPFFKAKSRTLEHKLLELLKYYQRSNAIFLWQDYVPKSTCKVEENDGPVQNSVRRVDVYYQVSFLTQVSAVLKLTQ